MTAPATLEPPELAATVHEAFAVRLPNFEGPFDLLLGLIARRRLDVTEVALSLVTDEFIAYTRARGGEWDLDQSSEFLVVAATLLDYKAARLLPAGAVEDEADLALLEARDLLFARLLQYRAYQQAAAALSRRIDDEARWHPREVGLEERHAQLLPELVLAAGPHDLARLAAGALAPRPEPSVAVAHLHAPPVSVHEQVQVLVERLRRLGTASFRALVADSRGTVWVVARFLALLELYRERAVHFEQLHPLGELTVRWSGEHAEHLSAGLGAEFDSGGFDSGGFDSGGFDSGGFDSTGFDGAGGEPVDDPAARP